MSNADEQLGGRQPKTANEEYFDAMVRHQIYLLRYAGGLTKDVVQLLNDSESKLLSLLLALPEQRPVATGQARRRLLQRLDGLRRLRREAWAAVGKELRSDLSAFALAEAGFAANAAASVVPVVIDFALPASNLLRSLTGRFPVEGKLLDQWVGSMQRSDIEAILQTVQRGMVQGQSNQDIARAVLGTRSVQGRNGVTQRARQHVQAVVRTATNAYSNEARRMMFEQNADIFQEELYVATLDARTTPICRSLDGKRFPRGEGPRPPLHISCRSLRVAVISDEAIGERPSKPVVRRRLLREYSERNNLGRISNRDALPHGHKGPFDTFERRRIRELVGQVPAKVTYGQWLKNQSRAFQEDVLGKTKAKLFRDGNLSLDRFVDRNGQELRLNEIAQKDSDAFRAAGLDPADF